jgi:beta-lactam-binding protein with PASTA domain
VCTVPSVRGRTVAQARRALARSRCALGRVRRAFSLRVVPGRVVSQSRRVGARVPRNTRVNVVVSRGRGR